MSDYVIHERCGFSKGLGGINAGSLGLSKDTLSRVGLDALTLHLWYATYLPVPAPWRSLLYHLLGTTWPFVERYLKLRSVLPVFSTYPTRCPYTARTCIVGISIGI